MVKNDEINIIEKIMQELPLFPILVSMFGPYSGTVSIKPNNFHHIAL